MPDKEFRRKFIKKYNERKENIDKQLSNIKKTLQNEWEIHQRETLKKRIKQKSWKSFQ